MEAPLPIVHVIGTNITCTISKSTKHGILYLLSKRRYEYYKDCEAVNEAARLLFAKLRILGK